MGLSDTLSLLELRGFPLRLNQSPQSPRFETSGFRIMLQPGGRAPVSPGPSTFLTISLVQSA